MVTKSAQYCIFSGHIRLKLLSNRVWAELVRDVREGDESKERSFERSCIFLITKFHLYHGVYTSSIILIILVSN